MVILNGTVMVNGAYLRSEFESAATDTERLLEAAQKIHQAYGRGAAPDNVAGAITDVAAICVEIVKNQQQLEKRLELMEKEMVRLKQPKPRVGW